MIKIFIGNIKIIDLSINKSEEPILYVISHGSWKDLFVIKKVLNNTRIVAAQSVMKFLGLGFILGPFLGCISTAPGKNNAAIKSGITILKGRENLAICPEGWASLDGKIKTFKTGAARIALGAETKVVPVFIGYGLYQHTWFLKLNFLLQVILNAINPAQRSNAYVIIGESFTLSNDVKESTKKMQSRVEDLQYYFNVVR